MTKHKTLKTYIDTGFGFPVELHDVPMVQVQGVWTPRINYNELTQAVLVALVLNQARLTGSQVHFIRLTLGLTAQQLAAKLGVTHPAVLKWEATQDRTTRMQWAMEKELRLLAGRACLSDSDFIRLYDSLVPDMPESGVAIIHPQPLLYKGGERVARGGL